MGDGASVVRPILRRRGQVLIGHASVRDQLDWCRDEGISHVVITHCGSQIVKADARTATARVKALGRERCVQVLIAYDGLKLMVRRTGMRNTQAVNDAQRVSYCFDWDFLVLEAS